MNVKVFLMVLLAHFPLSAALVKSKPWPLPREMHEAILKLVINSSNGPAEPKHLNMRKELHEGILTYIINSSATIEEATKFIRTWAHLNRNCYQTVNNATVTQNLLQDLKNHFVKARNDPRIWKLECYLRTSAAGKKWAERRERYKTAAINEVHLAECIIPEITSEGLRLPLFLMAHAPFPICVQSLERIFYSLHLDQHINARDNAAIVERVKEMYVSQHVKRISKQIKVVG